MNHSEKQKPRKIVPLSINKNCNNVQIKKPRDQDRFFSHSHSQKALKQHSPKQEKKKENLFNAREIELKTVVDPCQNLIPSNKVSTVHYAYVGSHLNPDFPVLPIRRPRDR